MRFCLWDYVTVLSHAEMLQHWSVIHYQMTFEWHSWCGSEMSIVLNGKKRANTYHDQNRTCGSPFLL